MGRKIFQNEVWYHMENKIEYDTEYQELGAYLCGRGPQEREKRQDLLRQLQEDGHPAYLALAAYGLLLENKNRA